MATMTGCVTCWREAVPGKIRCDECQILLVAAINLQILLGLPKRWIRRLWKRGSLCT